MRTSRLGIWAVGLGMLAASAAGCAARYQGRGLVLAVDPAASTITVSHDEIPGYMNAMVMPFTVRDPRRIGGVRPGDRIAFRLTVSDERSWIDRLQMLSAAPVDAGLTQTPAVPTLVPLGGAVPDFTLTNQDGEAVALSSLRGAVVAVTFIYTRCPLPDYCPRMIANLQAIERRFPERVGRDLALAAVTFDPQHDTAKRMKEYARFFKADRPGWQFLTGSLDEVSRVCALFGVEFWPEEGLITHTLQTAILDREGTLVASVEGKDYSPKQLADLVARTLAK
ncbi:MAG: SCO family protein [Vicinamibacterales bacterium]